jgi:glycine cleavage system H protein
MSNIPADRKYAVTHEWAQADGSGIVTVGISDHAQIALGDVVFVELPELGAHIDAGDEAGVVESVKAASDIYAPVSGEVVEVNEALESSPELANSDPYGEGWFFRMRADDIEELEALLDAEGYGNSLDEE